MYEGWYTSIKGMCGEDLPSPLSPLILTFYILTLHVFCTIYIFFFGGTNFFGIENFEKHKQ